MQSPPDLSFDFELRDGTPIRVRPLRSDDKERLRKGLERLSPDSRYSRFAGSKKGLSAKELRYLTELDWSKHQAWIAVDPNQEDEPALGVARCVRLEPSSVAEAAVAVVDPLHGKGLGTILLGVLTRSALEAEIDTFRAYVQGDNAPMLEIFHQLGAVTSFAEAGVVAVDLPLWRHSEHMPNTPAGRVLKRVAQELAPAVLNPLRRAPSS